VLARGEMKPTASLVLTTAITFAFVASACASSDRNAFEHDDASAPAPGDLGSSDASAGDAADPIACASEVRTAEPVQLDIHIMLDASGSMMGRTGKLKTGPTKWEAVKDALESFISDPKNAGVGVGLHTFPIVHAGAAAACSTDADCNVNGVDYGSCFLSACDYYDNGGLLPCDMSADCPNGAACLPLGECRSGSQVHDRCVVGGAPCKTGTCQAMAQSTCSRKECFVDDYDDTRVTIAPLPGNAPMLTSVIDSIPNPLETALTPTSMALAGGLAYAAKFAKTNPTHSVVVVMATDGLPTRCWPYDATNIANIASAYAKGAIRTFIIGVFADVEKPIAQPNLDQIAAGGATGKAMLVSTTGNVSADFQKALDDIRARAVLPCEYRVPIPASGVPDFGKVNVRFAPVGIPAATLAQRKDASACDANGGWYYETDATGVPSKVLLCPSTCEQVKRSTEGSRVEVLLGCATVVR
jgi:hypothetical protein